jgi:predicted transcriptional regulator
MYMKTRRTTIVLDPDLDILLKLEARRQKRSMTVLIQEALREKYQKPRGLPPGVGQYDSGRSDTSERIEELLESDEYAEHILGRPV